MISEELIFERLNEYLGIPNLCELRSKSRQTKYAIARIIYCEYLNRKKVHPENIATTLKRDRTTISHIQKKFGELYKFDKQFRDLADEVLKE